MEERSALLIDSATTEGSIFESCASLSELALSVNFLWAVAVGFLAQKAVKYQSAMLSTNWEDTFRMLLIMESRWIKKVIQWRPLVRSAFCPKKIDHSSGLTLHPGYNSV